MIIDNDPSWKKSDVGRFSAEMVVTNRKDALRAEDGLLPRDQVRSLRLLGVVDTGATRLVLPPGVVVALGLPVTGRTSCTFADGRKAQRDVVGDVQVEILGRSDVFSAVVEPGRTDALIGAIVMETLDFVANPVTQRLVPRDPSQILTEIGESAASR